MHTKLCEKKEKVTNLPKKLIMGVQVDLHTWGVLCEKKEKFTNLPKKFIMSVQVDHHTWGVHSIPKGSSKNECQANP